MIRYEEMSMNAWPAIRSRVYEGCILRASNGYTKRANSANPIHSRGTNPEALEAYADVFYRSQGLPTIFKMIESEGYDELDRYLDSRGYGIVDPTHVMTMDLETAGVCSGGTAVTTDYFYKEWIDSFIRCNSIQGKFVETAKAMLNLITVDVIVASVVADTNIVACGYGAIEDGYVGFYDIVVAPEYRKKGYGRALMEAIIAQARRQGASKAYLQVIDSNEAARRLYLGLGFREQYAYWYRRKDR